MITIIKILGCPACDLVIDEVEDICYKLGWDLTVRGPTTSERLVFKSFPIVIFPDKTIIGTGAIDEFKEGIRDGKYTSIKTN